MTVRNIVRQDDVAVISFLFFPNLRQEEDLATFSAGDAPCWETMSESLADHLSEPAFEWIL